MGGVVEVVRAVHAGGVGGDWACEGRESVLRGWGRECERVLLWTVQWLTILSSDSELHWGSVFFVPVWRILAERSLGGMDQRAHRATHQLRTARLDVDKQDPQRGRGYVSARGQTSLRRQSLYPHTAQKLTSIGLHARQRNHRGSHRTWHHGCVSLISRRRAKVQAEAVSSRSSNIKLCLSTRSRSGGHS